MPRQKRKSTKGAPCECSRTWSCPVVWTRLTRVDGEVCEPDNGCTFTTLWAGSTPKHSSAHRRYNSKFILSMASMYVPVSSRFILLYNLFSHYQGRSVLKKKGRVPPSPRLGSLISLGSLKNRWFLERETEAGALSLSSAARHIISTCCAVFMSLS